MTLQRKDPQRGTAGLGELSCFQADDPRIPQSHHEAQAPPHRLGQSCIMGIDPGLSGAVELPVERLRAVLQYEPYSVVSRGASQRIGASAPEIWRGRQTTRATCVSRSISAFTKHTA